MNIIKNQMKIFEVIFLTIIIILVFMSFIALVSIHWALYNNYSFSFSPVGINTYLTAFCQYKVLFISFITVITAYFGLLRLQVETDTNKDRIKQDRFLEWKTRLDILFVEIESRDPDMKKEFIKIRDKFFSQIYEINFSISNKEQLIQIFQKNFQGIIGCFEIYNKRFIENGGFYQNQNSSYSFDSFRYLLLNSFDETYTDMKTDLEKLYLTVLSTVFPAVKIDNTYYRSS